MLKPIEGQLGYGYRAVSRPREIQRHLPRLVALGLALLLIAALSWVSIQLILASSPASMMINAHHADGIIVDINTQDLTLSETDGTVLTFTCGQTCQDSFPHMQRHLREHAHTDIYYVSSQESRHYVALYVD